VKDQYTIIYYSNLYEDWEVYTHVNEKINAGPHLAQLMALGGTAPMVVEAYKADVLINVLNATSDEIKEMKKVWCSQCHTTDRHHKMDCSARR